MKNRTYSTKNPTAQIMHETEDYRLWMRPISGPEERADFLEKLAISSKFDMRYRGLVQFYGDDLIAYRQRKGAGRHTNEFLRVFAAYLTNNLEDNCPSSWLECTPAFWEEFISTYYPFQMKISTKRNETEIFFHQLKKFVRWLDQRAGTSWYGLIERYEKEYSGELKNCEQLLNDHTLITFPGIHQKGWDYQPDLDRHEREVSEYRDLVYGFFQISLVSDDLLTFKDLQTNREYEICNMTKKWISDGMILRGTIGTREDAFFWEWCWTDCVCPHKASDYIVFI